MYQGSCDGELGRGLHSVGHDILEHDGSILVEFLISCTSVYLEFGSGGNYGRDRDTARVHHRT